MSSKVEMAERLKTSRSQLDQLIDPENGNVTLETLARAANGFWPFDQAGTGLNVFLFDVCISVQHGLRDEGPHAYEDDR